MILPQKVQEKVNDLLSNNKTSLLKDVQKELTNKYKTKSGSGKSLIESKNDSLIYAVSRMPATYSVILTLLSQLKNQGFLKDIESAIDMGSGTGAGYFALREFDENLAIKLFERDKNMIEIFREIELKQDVCKFDLTKDELNQKADLVLTSYVLSELNEEQRLLAVEKLLKATKKNLLIIDTGTPKVWNEMMKIKSFVESLGFSIVAPCNNKICPLKDDYCQFFARVERSSIHRMVKDASLSYEDEKYFYLLISKIQDENFSKPRVIRRPLIKTNAINLVFCEKDKVSEIVFTKKNREEYKHAKKLKINDVFDFCNTNKNTYEI